MAKELKDSTLLRDIESGDYCYTREDSKVPWKVLSVREAVGTKHIDFTHPDFQSFEISVAMESDETFETSAYLFPDIYV